MKTLTDSLTIHHPPILECGPGTASKVGEWTAAKGYRRVLVVADAFNADRIDVLNLPGTADVSLFADVVPEPDIANLETLVKAAEGFQPDLIIGFGGGSAMDLAKLASVLIGTGKSIADVEGKNNAPARKTALVQVSTTSGTGSEVGIRSLVTDPIANRKVAVESIHMLADMAVIDAELTVSMPAHVTAATGVDALAHCVEAYTNKNAHPIIDHYALQGIRLIGTHLPRAVANGADTEARTAMALASLYGGICLGPVNTAAGHAIAYPLGTRHHLAHGIANALVFPHVLAFNAPVAQEKTAHVLDALGTKDALAFCRNLGIDMNLANHGVPESDIAAMADEAFAIKRLLDNNPRDVTLNDITAVYEASFRA